jgi:hypothetical protein
MLHFSIMLSIPFFILMLNVILVSVIMLSVIMLNVIVYPFTTSLLGQQDSLIYDFIQQLALLHFQGPVF